MASLTYSDKEISHNVQVFFLVVAEFVIKVTFGPSELAFFKRNTLEEFLEVWEQGGFLTKKESKIDFTLSLEEKLEIEVIKKKNEKEEYNLSFKKDFADRKVTSYYHQGLLSFQLVFKEILAYLLERNGGLLLHASSCLDKKGDLRVFFAPSGGGKTTTASMLLKVGYRPFGDDLLVIRKIKGKWIYFSPPFVEKNLMPKKTESNSAQLFFIVKGNSFSKREIVDKGVVLKLLLRQVWLRENEIGKQVFKNALDFVKNNKFYRLETRLDTEGLIKIIDES